MTVNRIGSRVHRFFCSTNFLKASCYIKQGEKMIKGYIIRDEFISVMKNSTSVLDWMEGRSEYQAQLAAILIAPDVIFQQLKTRFQYRDDMFLVPDKITYYNSLTQRTSTLEKKQWHLILSDKAEYPFLYELKQLRGTLVLSEIDL